MLFIRLILALVLLLPLGEADARLFGRGGAASVSALLFSSTLINDGSTTSAANSPTSHVSLSFKDSDSTGLAVGKWPILLIGAVPQPYTPYGVGYWPSGRIRHMGAIIKPTVSTAAAASQTVAVWSGGSQPSASGRTVTDFYNQNCRIEAIAAPSISNMAGSTNWVAKAVANDTHTYVVKTESWGDGPAGMTLALWLNFFPADGSFNATSTAPHGQLMVKWYIHLMNDGSNNLGGTLMDARVVQPKYNNDTPAKAARAFTTLRYNCNGTTTDFTLDKTARSFSATGTATQWQTSVPNPWYTGAGGNNQFAAQITVAGTTGLSTTTLYYGTTWINSTTLFTLSSDHSNGFNAVASVGSGTLQPLYVVGTNNSLYGLDSNWGWIYNQGTGSIAAANVSNNWRMRPATTTDVAYLIDTNLIPAFDKSLSGTTYGGTITPYASWPYSYDVNSIGPTLNDQGNGGDRPDLGAFTGWASQYAFNFDQNGLTQVRAIAYATHGSTYCFLDQTTLTPPNMAEVNGGTSFVGYPASVATTLYTFSSAGVGYTAPAWPLDDTFGYLKTEAEHVPEHSYAAWIIGDARPEYWDILNEQASRLLSQIPNSDSRNPTVPVTMYGIVAWPMGQEMRTWGFTLRGILYAALGSPGKAGDVTKLAPDASDSAGYWKTLADNNMTWEKIIMDPAVTGSLANLSAYAASTGYWASFIGAGAGNPQISTQNYQQPYGIVPAGVYVAASGNVNGKAWLQRVADWMAHARAMGPWAMAPYYAHNARGSIAGMGGTQHWPQIQNDYEYAQWGMHGPVGTSWQTSTSPYFQMDFMAAYSPHNGDFGVFDQAGDGPSNFTAASVTYCLRDVAFVSGTTYKFNLATTCGGTVIVPAASGSSTFNAMMWHPTVYPAANATGVCGNVTMGSSCINHYGMVNQLAHAGVSVVSGVLTDLNSMVTVDGLKVVSDARYLLGP